MWRELASWVLIGVGLFFFLVSTIGILRLPDVFTRIHATTKGDTLGAGCVLFGLTLISGDLATNLKLLFILAFLWVTAPTAAHCIARSVYQGQSGEAEGGSE